MFSINFENDNFSVVVDPEPKSNEGLNNLFIDLAISINAVCNELAINFVSGDNDSKAEAAKVFKQMIVETILQIEDTGFLDYLDAKG